MITWHGLYGSWTNQPALALGVVVALREMEEEEEEEKEKKGGAIPGAPWYEGSYMEPGMRVCDLLTPTG